MSKLNTQQMHNILLRHNRISIPKGTGVPGEQQQQVATVLMNLCHYGYSLNEPATRSLLALNGEELASWWGLVESELASITGDDKKIGDFVVYKNFPKEVLDKSAAEYWYAQILMYWGLPKGLFAQEAEPREGMSEQPPATVLRKANYDTLNNILDSYVSSASRWKSQEQDDAIFLANTYPVNFAKFGFKENLVALATLLIQEGKQVKISTATDVLRLAAGLSDGDISLREKVKFKSFNRNTRQYLLTALEACPNLVEDVARRSSVWKKFLHNLHPWDYKMRCPLVCEVADKLYNNRLVTFNSTVEKYLEQKNDKVLELLSTRPGEYRRRLVHLLELFGGKAADIFVSDDVLGKLKVSQLVSMRRFLETVNIRNFRVFPPKGNWNRLQIAESKKISPEHVKHISSAIGKILKERVPNIKFLDEMTELIKLPSNDGEVSPYARGTVFPIPEDVNFIRTASYWEQKGQTVWFDNGWNLFDSNWNSKGTCCWNENSSAEGSAVFSGDPVNSTEMRGRGCQLIDLYLPKLKARGVKYAVWSVLCFSGVPFSDATDVFAALQWGAEAQTGKLFEPSRCQLAFPLKGKQLTKYLCYIDVDARELVYMDANLSGEVSSATKNEDKLKEQMPAFVEYLYSLPTVYDLFSESVDEEEEEGHVLYSDKDISLKDDVRAYVFRPENEENSYTDIDVNEILTR